jgi:hypothetical protein
MAVVLVLGVARERHQPQRQLPQRRQQADDLLALAAVRQGQHHIGVVNHAQVAVDSAGRIQHISSRAGGIERAGDFLSDVGRLAGAGDSDAAGAAMEQVDRLQKRLAEAIGDQFEGSRLAPDNLPRIGEPVGILSQDRWGMYL